MIENLILQKIAKSYDTGSSAHQVLENVSFEAAPGDTIAIAGPSGSGKSTLLHIIGSLDRPTGGNVMLGPVDIARLSGTALADFRSQKVGFVFQDHHLLPQLTALENVVLPSLALNRKQSDAAERSKSLLERVGVSDRAGAFPARMSGGERQRVAIARALINRPRLLLCDEPTGNLDRENGMSVADLFLQLAEDEKVIVVMVTHNIELAERFGRRYELRGGVLRGDSLEAR